MKFKKGDFVRCIRGSMDRSVQNGKIYIIDRHEDIYIYVDKFNYTYRSFLDGWLPNRFVKVEKEDLTSDEKFSYIKYKLGVKNECQKKQKQ